MAESKGSKRYNHGPKIKDAEMPEGDKVSGGGAPEEAAAKAKKTAGSGKAEVEKGDAEGPKASIDAGTDGIPVVHERHGRERGEMHDRHRKEQQSMHTRHEQEHKAMHERHMTEHTAGFSAEGEDIGESGTE